MCKLLNMNFIIFSVHGDFTWRVLGRYNCVSSIEVYQSNPADKVLCAETCVDEGYTMFALDVR